MREFEYIFDEGLTKGIRADIRTRTHEQILLDVYNLQMGAKGLEPYTPVELLDSVYDVIQRLKDDYAEVDVNIVTCDIRTYSVVTFLSANGYRYTWVAILLPGGGYTTIVNQQNCYATVRNIASFGEYDVLVSDCTPYAFTGTSKRSALVTSLVGQVPSAQFGCSFKGQYFCAGPTVQGWLTISNEVSAKYVFYSDIGSMNMVPNAQNEAGFSYIPSGFDVMYLKPLEHHLVVYTAGDIWIMRPVADPAPAFKLTRHKGIGLMSSDAIAGDSDQHLLVDFEGVVWLIKNSLEKTNNLATDRLGYEHIFLGQDDSLRVIYDAATMSWRINCDKGNYLFADNELTRVYQKIEGFYYTTDEYLGIGTEADDHCASITTDKLDFNYAGIKTITGVEVSAGVSREIFITIESRFNVTDKYLTSPATLINASGGTGRPAAGIDFRFKIQFKYFEESTIDWFKIRFKMSDMRGIRGVYAPPPRGQFA